MLLLTTEIIILSFLKFNLYNLPQKTYFQKPNQVKGQKLIKIE